DWADYVSLAGDVRPDVQLPTIFTIAFGLDYAVLPDTTPDCDVYAATYSSSINYTSGNGAREAELCLGVGLMRYIADVGDNNRIDGDYPTPAQGDENYGNYFNAPDGPELDDVFDEIARKLFTRISR
ncbi:MAG: hypothetical protein ACOYL5_19135, partial [Phototrophicaceae bacterium]